MRAADPVHNVELRRNAQGHDSVVFAFPYRADIVDAVRAIPGRRFDWEAKEWWAPRADAVAPFVKGVLERHPSLSVAPDVDAWLSRAVTRLGRPRDAPAGWTARATSSWTRSPASWRSRSPSWPPSAAAACGCRSRARWPRRCWRPRAPAWTRARCAAHPPAGGPGAGARHARRSSRATASRASSSTSTGTRRRCPPSWRCPPARRTAARSRRPVSAGAARALPAHVQGRARGQRRARCWTACAASTTPRSTTCAARAPSTRRPGARSRTGWAASCGRSSAPASHYVLHARRTFLADEQGLGKTVQALAALEADDAYPAVIVCPAGLKLNWRARDRALAAAPLACTRDPGTSVGAGEADIIGHQLRDRPRPPRAAALRRPKALVLDESHYVKNPRAKRTQAVRRLAEALPDDALQAGAHRHAGDEPPGGADRAAADPRPAVGVRLRRALRAPLPGRGRRGAHPLAPAPLAASCGG